MVGLVIVSHSRALADALAALAQQVTPVRIPISVAAGVGPAREDFGTDALEIKEAIESVYGEDGVLVLMDLGSALLSAETALELFPPECQQKICFCAAPLVEGALAAVVQIALGADLPTVCREAQQALLPKLEMLGSPGETLVAASALLSPLPGGREIALTLHNLHGLHARPAARFVQTAARFDAQVHVSNQTTGKGPVDARSFNALATLGALKGHTVRVAASGPQAGAVLQALQRLVEANFDEAPAPVPPGERPASTDGSDFQGVPVSEGVAIGLLYHYRPSLPPLPSGPADEPGAAWGRLQEAVSRVERAIEARRSQIAALAGEAQAAIFDAHRLILNDPQLQAAAHQLIFVEGQNEAAAWDAAVREVAARFHALEDPYLSQRSADVVDVGEQVLLALAGAAARRIELDRPVILLARDLTPTQTAQLDREKILGIITLAGGPTSHSAILARSMGIPAVSGLPVALSDLPEDTRLGLDGGTGAVWVNPAEGRRAELQARRAAWLEARRRLLEASRQPAITLDGHAVEVAANVGNVQDARAALQHGAEGIGLLRTEFMFLARTTPPDEAEQVAALLEIGEVMGAAPVVVRTLDAGGDKPLPYLSRHPEANPFLGLRAIRLSLQQPELFNTQLRAILRAAAGRNFRIMFPMIATLAELERAKAALASAHEALLAEGVPHAWPVETGIMVEVPAAALMAPALAAHVDFFSIGTNDLTQYTFAAERGNPDLPELADALHPAVLHLIRATVEAARACGKWVGVCGELAGDPAAAAVLLGLGVRELSMNPASIPRAKAAIRGLRASEARACAERALGAKSAAEVRAQLAGG